MQTKRAMILVSSDPESIRLGATELIQHLTEALIAYDLQDEVEISTLSNVGTSNILPLVVVYPEATVYGIPRTTYTTPLSPFPRRPALAPLASSACQGLRPSSWSTRRL